MSICNSKNFLGVVPPDPPLKGEGRREGEGEKGRGGKGREEKGEEGGKGLGRGNCAVVNFP